MSRHPTWKHPAGTRARALDQAINFDQVCSATKGVWPNVPENLELMVALIAEKEEERNKLLRSNYPWLMKKELLKVE